MWGCPVPLKECTPTSLPFPDFRSLSLPPPWHLLKQQSQRCCPKKAQDPFPDTQRTADVDIHSKAAIEQQQQLKVTFCIGKGNKTSCLAIEGSILSLLWLNWVWWQLSYTKDKHGQNCLREHSQWCKALTLNPWNCPRNTDIAACVPKLVFPCQVLAGDSYGPNPLQNLT